jgi:hypothetical protein
MSVNREMHRFEGRMEQHLIGSIRIDETTQQPLGESDALSVETSTLSMWGVGWVVSHSHWPR